MTERQKIEAWASPPTKETALQLSEELERLPGVVAAAVWLDETGGVAQVRIHTQATTSASIVAHAATRVLERRTGVVDPSVLRVIPVGTLAQAPEGVAPGRYLLLHDIGWTREGSRITCRVRLARGADILTGEAAELDSESGRARAAALATLRAAEKTRDGLALGLEAVAPTPLFGRRYLSVAVEAAMGRRFAQLAGMVQAEPARSLEEAACLATLRAIDRWLSV